MNDEEPVDYGAVRQRFPWAGLAVSGEDDLSSRYREIMREAQRDRRIVETTIEAIRHSA